MKTSELSEQAKRFYRIAALAYFSYGVVYMIGAVIELTPDRKRPGWWMFYIVGAAITVGLPFLLARGHRWLAGVLGVLTAGKALYLFYGLGRDFRLFNLFFGTVALIATTALLTAFVKGKTPVGETRAEAVQPPNS